MHRVGRTGRADRLETRSGDKSHPVGDAELAQKGGRQVFEVSTSPVLCVKVS